MEINRNHIIGSSLVGITVFIGLGVVGYGADTLAIWFSELGIDLVWSKSLSRISFGLAAVGAIIFIALGSQDVCVSHERVKQAIDAASDKTST